MKKLGLFPLAIASLLIAAFGVVGCSGGSEMSEKETKTLESNLTSPVDVDKIRAEYNKQNGGGGGAGGPKPAEGP